MGERFDYAEEPEDFLLEWDMPELQMTVAGVRWWCDGTAALRLRDPMPAPIPWCTFTRPPSPENDLAALLAGLVPWPDADPLLSPRLAPLLVLGTPRAVLVEGDPKLKGVALYDETGEIVGLLMSALPPKSGGDGGLRPLSAWLSEAVPRG